MEKLEDYIETNDSVENIMDTFNKEERKFIAVYSVVKVMERETLYWCTVVDSLMTGVNKSVDEYIKYLYFSLNSTDIDKLTIAHKVLLEKNL